RASPNGPAPRPGTGPLPAACAPRPGWRWLRPRPAGPRRAAADAPRAARSRRPGSGAGDYRPREAASRPDHRRCRGPSRPAARPGRARGWPGCRRCPRRRAAGPAATASRPPVESGWSRSAADGRPWSGPGPDAARSSPSPGRGGLIALATVIAVVAREQPGQQGLLRVQAVLGLVPDNGGGPVDHGGADLLAAVGGQAVQEDPAGQLHQLIGDLVRGEGLLSSSVLAFLAHRHPGV